MLIEVYNNVSKKKETVYSGYPFVIDYSNEKIEIQHFNGVEEITFTNCVIDTERKVVKIYEKL